MSENQGMQEFAAAYTKLLVAVWKDAKLADLLRSDPRAVAADAGLVIPSDVEVKVVKASDDLPDDPQMELEMYYGDFQKGLADKVVTLAIPEVSMLKVQDLTSEELAGVAGGLCIRLCCSCSC